MRLAILSVLLCLAALSQSVHVAPNGRELVFSLGGTNTATFTTDRRKALARINQFKRDISGLQDQLAIAHTWLREHPPRIDMMRQEIATQEFHLRMMDLMSVTNLPPAPITPPPPPPGMTPLPGAAPLPVNPSVQNGLPPGHSPEFISGVKTAR